jgi:hypothetical protein
MQQGSAEELAKMRAATPDGQVWDALTRQGEATDNLGELLARLEARLSPLVGMHADGLEEKCLASVAPCELAGRMNLTADAIIDYAQRVEGLLRHLEI